MKITKALREFIIFEIKHYARKMGIQPGKLPDVALEIIPKKILGRGGGKASSNNMYGVFFEESGKERVADLLFLNVDKHPTRKSLSHTIVHELVHLRHPTWEHGKKFNDLVEFYLNG
jgi:hypothetical protein